MIVIVANIEANSKRKKAKVINKKMFIFKPAHFEEFKM